MFARLLILLALPGICSAGILKPLTGRSLVLVPQSILGNSALNKSLLFSADLTTTPFADFARGSGAFTFTRASEATIHNPSGEVVVVAANLPRFGFASEGILFERGAINAIEWSEEMENIAWDNSLSSSAFHDTQLAPTAISATTADEIRETADDTAQIISQEYWGSANGIDVLTVYLKQGTGRTLGYIEWFDFAGGDVHQFYDLAAGTLLSTSITGAGISILHSAIESLTNGWYRCTMVVDTAANTQRAINFGPAIEDLKGTYSGDAAKGIIAWGAMVRVRASTDTSYQTSYVKSEADGGTRFADSLVYTAAGNLPTSGPFTLIGTMAQPNGLFHSSVLIMTDNTLGDGAPIITDVPGKPNMRYLGPGYDISGSAAAVLTERRYAVTWATDEARGFSADVSDGFDATPTTFPSMALLRVGTDGGELAGHAFVKNIRVYSGVLSAWELSQVQ